MIDLSKLTSNKNILSKVEVLGYNKVCCQTLSILKPQWSMIQNQ